MQVLDLLGPKTEADLEKPAKQKVGEPAKEKVGEPAKQQVLVCK